MGVRLAVIMTIVLLLSLLVTTYRYHDSMLRVQNKTLASTGFLMIGIFAFLMHIENWRIVGLILIALIASLMGDIILGIADYDLIDMKNKYFVVAIAWFNIAQLFYVLAFGLKVDWKWADLVIPLTMSIGVMVISLLPYFNFRGCTFLVMVYGFALGIMLKKVFDFGLSGIIDTYAVGLMGAAILFVISDFLLIFKYFYYKSHMWITLVNLTCYYLAQILFALSIMYL